MKLSLVIPLYNEIARLPLLRAGLKEFINKTTGSSLEPFEVILVNDGSRDGTHEGLDAIARELEPELSSRGSSIRVIDLEQNSGKGFALKRGVLESQGEWVLTLDADMATPPTQALEWERNGWLTSRPGQTIIFFGSREAGSSVVTDKSHRRVLGRVFNFCVQVVSGLPFEDTQCGFKLYPKRIAKAAFGALKEHGWAHDVEIALRVRSLGGQIEPLPIRWQAIDVSKVEPLRDAIKMFLALLKIRFRIFLELELGFGSKNTQESSSSLISSRLAWSFLTFFSFFIGWAHPLASAWLGLIAWWGIGTALLRLEGQKARLLGLILLAPLPFLSGSLEAGSATPAALAALAWIFAGFVALGQDWPRVPSGRAVKLVLPVAVLFTLPNHMTLVGLALVIGILSLRFKIRAINTPLYESASGFLGFFSWIIPALALGFIVRETVPLTFWFRPGVEPAWALICYAVLGTSLAWVAGALVNKARVLTTR